MNGHGRKQRAHRQAPLAFDPDAGFACDFSSDAAFFRDKPAARHSRSRDRSALACSPSEYVDSVSLCRATGCRGGRRLRFSFGQRDGNPPLPPD